MRYSFYHLALIVYPMQEWHLAITLSGRDALYIAVFLFLLLPYLSQIAAAFSMLCVLDRSCQCFRSLQLNFVSVCASNKFVLIVLSPSSVRCSLCTIMQRRRKLDIETSISDIFSVVVLVCFSDGALVKKNS